jgi:hypothetical protein
MAKHGPPRPPASPTSGTGPRVALVTSQAVNEPTGEPAAHVGAVSGAGVATIQTVPTVLALQSRELLGRVCAFALVDGQHCRATPLRDEAYCFWHSPDHAQEAADARRLGGLRRRREKAITAVYELEGLATIDGIRRVLDIVVADALALENSVARSRVLIAAAMAATRLVEVEALEAGRAAQASEVTACSGEESCPD